MIDVVFYFQVHQPYRLRKCKPGDRIKKGDYFDVIGGRLVFPKDRPEFSLYGLLAVLPGDQKLDFRKLAAALGLPKMTLASAEEATQQTGCVIGAIRPFSLAPQITLVVDPGLVARFGEIAFNAGRLDRSMVLNSEDYVRIAQPAQHAICTEAV